MEGALRRRLLLTLLNPLGVLLDLRLSFGLITASIHFVAIQDVLHGFLKLPLFLPLELTGYRQEVKYYSNKLRFAHLPQRFSLYDF